MTRYKPGDVVLVSFPFTDQSGTKKRPAVVVSSETYNADTPDVIILPITSQVRRMPVFGEFAIAEWQAAGLLKKCFAGQLLKYRENRVSAPFFMSRLKFEQGCPC